MADTPQSRRSKVREIDAWVDALTGESAAETAQDRHAEAERRVAAHREIVKERHVALWKAGAYGGVDALVRLCKANALITSGNKHELLNRLVNLDAHGRPGQRDARGRTGRCPKCEAKLHLVCEPSDLQPNEPVRLECRRWHSGPVPKPCGWKVAITPANKSEVLRLRLADSWESDLSVNKYSVLCALGE